MELQTDLHSCSYCSFLCKLRLDLIKHSLRTHSIEYGFRLKCGINGCPHFFTFGATFSSFKTHASRKHPKWQEHINSSIVPASSSHTDVVEDSCTTTYACDDQTFIAVPEVPQMPCERALMNYLSASLNVAPRSAEHTAALFLLNFQEKYRLSQRTIDFAVGAINSIVDTTLESVKEAIRNSLQQQLVTVDIDSFTHNDPFGALQTQYQQAKFYREEFGLVVIHYVVYSYTTLITTLYCLLGTCNHRTW